MLELALNILMYNVKSMKCSVKAIDKNYVKTYLLCIMIFFSSLLMYQHILKPAAWVQNTLTESRWVLVDSGINLSYAYICCPIKLTFNIKSQIISSKDQILVSE